jgi:squalene-associated FAD-dependent desaturase
MFRTSKAQQGKMRVVVVGAGIAGISSALALADDDSVDEVILIEARKHIGGRVSSVTDPHSGLELDNCQHACFRVYERFLQLIARAEAKKSIKLQGRTVLTFTDPYSGKSSALKDGRLAPPNHMLGSMLKFPFLSLRDKTRMRRVVSAFAKMSEQQRLELDDEPFIDWLRRHRQTEPAINRFWRFFVLAALNMSLEEASTAVCVLLFKRGLFGDPHAFDVGAFQDHLSGALDAPFRAALDSAGVDLRCSTQVSRLLWEDGKCRGVVVGDATIKADSVVLATPHHIVTRMLRGEGASDSAIAVAARTSALGYTALIGLHALYDSIKSGEETTFTALVDEPIIQMIFNRNAELSEANQPPDGLQWLSTPISFADPYLEMSDGELQTEFERVADSMWPDSKARLQRFFVVRTKRATCAFPIGSHKLRPAAGDAGQGIALAGDYTDQGWPSTMEGAARSGLVAAAHVLGRSWNPDSPWPDWPEPPRRDTEGWTSWDCE